LGGGGLVRLVLYEHDQERRPIRLWYARQRAVECPLDIQPRDEIVLLMCSVGWLDVSNVRRRVHARAHRERTKAHRAARVAHVPTMDVTTDREEPTPAVRSELEGAPRLARTQIGLLNEIITVGGIVAE